MSRKSKVYFVKVGENQNLIRVSDFYKKNCSEQKYLIVKDDVLTYLINKKREEKKREQRDYRNLVPFGLDETYLGELCGIYVKSAEDSFMDMEASRMLRNAMREVNPAFGRRFYLYYAVGMTMDKIGELDGVSHSAVSRSIKKTSDQLKELLSYFYDDECDDCNLCTNSELNDN